MKKYCIFVFILIFLAQYSFAEMEMSFGKKRGIREILQNVTTIDGNEWEKYSDAQKIFYINIINDRESTTLTCKFKGRP